MTGPSLRHWLTGLVFALLAHLALAAILMSLLQEQSREAASGDPAGLEVTLFPGFREAIQAIAPEDPTAPGGAAVPAPPAPVPSVDPPPEAAPAATASPVPVPEPAPQVAVKAAPSLAPREVSPTRETESVAELVGASPAPEPSPPATAATPHLPTTDTTLTLQPSAAQHLPARPAGGSSTAPLETLPALEPQLAVQPRPTASEASLSPSPVETAAAVEPELGAAPMVPEPALAPPAFPVESVTANEPESADEPLPAAASAAAEPPLESLPAEPVQTTAAADIAEAAVAADVPVRAASPVTADPVPLAAAPIGARESAAVMPPTANTETIPSFEGAQLAPQTVTGAREISPPTETAAEVAPARDAGAVPDQPAQEPAPETREVAGAEERYFAALRDWLDRHKDYPRIAQRRGEEGTVWLAFTLNRHGMVVNHAIVRSSGHTLLDNTVEHLIRRAQPLPAIPPELGTNLLEVRVPIEFRLER